MKSQSEESNEYINLEYYMGNMLGNLFIEVKNYITALKLLACLSWDILELLVSYCSRAESRSSVF